MRLTRFVLPALALLPASALAEVPALAPTEDATIVYLSRSFTVANGVETLLPYGEQTYTAYFSTTGATIDKAFGQLALQRPDLQTRLLGEMDAQGRFTVLGEDEFIGHEIDAFRDTLVAGGTETVAGLDCTLFTGALTFEGATEAAGTGEFCVTADGLVLRSRITSILSETESGVTALEATSVTYAPLDPALFDPAR